MLIRTFAGVCAAALMLVGAGCGDDEEEPAAEDAATAPVVTTDTAGTAELPETETETGERGESPEDQPGGAGDEEAARSEVVLEFSRGGLTPTEVRIAPFIPVVLIIRSDGTEYDLSYSGPASGGGANGTTKAEFEIDGMRPGQEVEIEERNTGSRARIVASDAAGP